MIVPDHESICHSAEPYYYDFLCGNKQEDIPDALWQHIGQCDHCKTEVYLLKAALSRTEKHSGSVAMNTAITTNLEFHFAHTGQPVGCDTVKPFLPTLADPAFEVRIPTPITVHIDKCQQCASELEIIRQLNLSHSQLCRLGQIFAEDINADQESCRSAQEVLPSVNALELGKATSSTLRHLCVCPDCRELLFQQRQEVCDGSKVRESASEGFPCESVTDKYLFDYCFPYGIDPAEDQYAKFRSSLTSHVSKCPACLGRMQTLHRTVSGIIDRAESGVITCFSVKDASKLQATGSPEDVYSQWPIEVNVLDTRSESNCPAAESESPSGSVAQVQRSHGKQGPAYLNIKRFVKPLATAAAILLVVLVALYGPSLKATDLSQIYENLAKVKNVHITSIDPDHSEVIQEIWISRELELKLFKNKNRYELWDLKQKERKTKDLNTGAISSIDVDEEIAQKVAQTLVGPLNMLPFSRIADFPKNSKWYRVAEDSVKDLADNMDIYEIVWTEETIGGPLLHLKWRGFIESETKLPLRIELYEKDDVNQEYELVTVAEVLYPETDMIQNLLQEIGL